MSAHPDEEFAGRTALVTGAASGIGQEVARRLHAAGARVVLVDRDEERLRATADALGDRAQAVVADVTDEDAVAAAVAAAGPIAVAVNAAGAGTLAWVRGHPTDQWRAVVDLCLTGTFLCLKHEAAAMTGGGAIVNLSSLNASQPAEGFAAYGAAKAGVEMLTRITAMELAPDGVRVNAVAPGLVDTPLTSSTTGSPIVEDYLDNTPLARVGRVDDIAEAVLYLAGPRSSFVTGEILHVDGGAHTSRYARVARAALPR